MGQNFINHISWVDIHNIYYIIKKLVTTFDDFEKWITPFLMRMMQIELNKLLPKMKMTKNSKNIHTKDTINDYVYVVEIS